MLAHSTLKAETAPPCPKPSGRTASTRSTQDIESYLFLSKQTSELTNLRFLIRFLPRGTTHLNYVFKVVWERVRSISSDSSRGENFEDVVSYRKTGEKVCSNHWKDLRGRGP